MVVATTGAVVVEPEKLHVVVHLAEVVDERGQAEVPLWSGNGCLGVGLVGCGGWWMGGVICS